LAKGLAPSLAVILGEQLADDLSGTSFGAFQEVALLLDAETEVAQKVSFGAEVLHIAADCQLTNHA
jgi:hypothetical protein